MSAFPFAPTKAAFREPQDDTDSACLNPVCQVSHLNGHRDIFGESRRPSPEWEPVMLRPLASLLSTPHSSTLKEKNLNNTFFATDLGTKRMTAPMYSVVIDERSSPDERAPAMPASGTFRAVALAMTPRVEFGAGRIRDDERGVKRK